LRLAYLTVEMAIQGRVSGTRPNGARYGDNFLPAVLLQNHFVVLAAKCFFIAAATTDTICTIQKMSLFVPAITDRYKKLQLGVGCLCQPTQKIDFQKQKKNSRTQIQAHRAYFQALLTSVGDAKEEAVEPEPAIQTRGRACHRAPPPTC
jgi:hypothetical protein